jgi:uncharacterized protein YndB with AHSA1/START domain
MEPIRHSILINAPIKTVWRVLTTPEQVAVWVGAIGFQPQVGAKFEFHAPPQGDWNGITYSEVLEIEPLRRLVFSWAVPGVPATQVEFTLRAAGEQTEVTLVHSGWEQFPPEMIKPVRDGLDGGWGGHVMPQLKQAAEKAAA